MAKIRRKKNVKVYRRTIVQWYFPERDQNQKILELLKLREQLRKS